MKSHRRGEEMNLDFLLDTLTNVVGILILVLVLNTLNIRKAVERIRELDPSQFGVTVEMLTEMVQQRDETQETVRELKVETFGLDVQLTSDLRELTQQQQRMTELLKQEPQEPTVNPLKKIREVVEKRTEQLEKLQQQVTTTKEEVESLTAQLAETPEMKLPPPKVVTLPNPRSAPKGTKPVLFILRENKLMYFNPDEMKERVMKRVQFLMRPLLARAGPKGQIDCQALVNNYNKSPISDDDFRTELRVENFRLMLVYEHRGAGETTERFVAGTSRYQRLLRLMDPQKNYARFLVWPDSFEAYVAARNVCDERGVLAGWQPYDENYQWKVPLGIKVDCEGKPAPPAKPPVAAKPDPKAPPPPPPDDVID